MRLAYGEAADGVTWKTQFDNLLGAFAAQIGKGGALHDAELPLAEIAVAPRALLKIVARAASPFRRALQRGFRFLAGRRRFDALIEDHGDVRPERELNLGGFFGREEMLRAV